MRKQSLKFSAMFLLAVAVAFVAAVASANAQSTVVRANIPFDFTVGDTALPAGQYICRRLFDTSDRGIRITSADGRESAARLTQGVQATASSKNQARLVFHKYGDRYYLAQVWTSGNTGRELFKSPGERALKREMRRIAKNPLQNEVAQNASDPETVTIIASLQ